MKDNESHKKDEPNKDKGKKKDKKFPEKKSDNKPDKKKEEDVIVEKTHEPGLPVNDPNTGYIPFGG